MGLTELAELAIGDEQCTKSSQTVKCLLAVLLSGRLVNRSVWSASVASVDSLALPDEVL